MLITSYAFLSRRSQKEEALQVRASKASEAGEKEKVIWFWSTFLLLKFLVQAHTQTVAVLVSIWDHNAYFLL